MPESNPQPGDVDQGTQEIERGIAEFMQAMDAFISSWTDAVRRFADEPVALKRFRENREAPSPRRDGDRTTTVFEIRPVATAFPHPLWDRELDG